MVSLVSAVAAIAYRTGNGRGNLLAGVLS